jgi:hypothetical protein
MKTNTVLNLATSAGVMGFGNSTGPTRQTPRELLARVLI